MDEKTIEAVNQEVHAKFPYLAAIQPVPKDLPDGCVALTYSATVKTDNGFSLPVKVKAIISPQGKILNITSSR